SLHYYFPWAIKTLVKWTAFCVATDRRMRISQNTRDYFTVGDRDDLSYEEKLAAYRKLADTFLQVAVYEEFCAQPLAHVDELEAGDSGVRSLVSVQGSLAMFAIWRWGSEEQKQRWLPAMHAGEAIGCFGLTEPDAGSDPGSMRTHARRDGSDWILNGTKMWITNGTIADVAVVWARTDEGAINGFLVEKGMPGFEAPEMHKKLSLRASVT